MKLLQDWKHIAAASWSFRFGVAAFILTGLEMVISVYGADWIPGIVPRWARLLLIMVVAGGAPVARLLAQRNMRDEPKRAEVRDATA